MVDFTDLREKARRFFLGRTGVHTVLLDVKCLNINNVKRNVPTNPIRSKVTVLNSNMLSWSREPVKGQRLNLFIRSPQAKGGRLTFIDKKKSRTLPIVPQRAQVIQAIDVISKMPQTRANRVATLPDKFKRKGIIAFFYPLIQDCVVKSVLEKESGTLHVWYNQNCSKKRGQVLCLVSDVGKKPPLSWKWF